MGFKDVFKKSFLEGFTSMDISAGRIMATFAVTCILACYVFLIYRLMTRKSFYSKGFNVSLAAMSVITAAIILAMQSNLVISLGMVGALSIVRFRTAVKDPMDLVFLFWAIAEGILCGASLLPLALLGCPILGIFLLVFANHQQKDNPYLIIVRLMDGELEQKIEGYIRSEVKKMQLKSKTVTGEAGTEVIYEIRPKDNDSAFVNRISGMQGVESAVMVSYDGNYAA